MDITICKRRRLKFCIFEGHRQNFSIFEGRMQKFWDFWAPQAISIEVVPQYVFRRLWQKVFRFLSAAAKILRFLRASDKHFLRFWTCRKQRCFAF